MDHRTVREAAARIVAAAPPRFRQDAEDLEWAFGELAQHGREPGEPWGGPWLLVRDALVGLCGDAVVPRVVDATFALLELPLWRSDWVANRLAFTATLVEKWRAGSDQERTLAPELEGAFVAHRQAALGWVGRELAEYGILISRHIRPMQRSLVERLLAVEPLTAVGLVALAALPPTPPAAFALARQRLGAADEELRAAAAILLQRDPALDDETAARIDDVLGPGTSGPSLASSVGCEVLPLPMTWFRGALRDASVVFVGERVTSVRYDGKTSTVPVVFEGARVGAVVRIGVSPQGIVRAIVHGERRVDLDLRGEHVIAGP